jgi:predicted transcriptional regulator
LTQQTLFDSRTPILLSLHKKHYDRILNNAKRAEYRLRFPSGKIEAYVYCPSPHKQVVGVILLEPAIFLNKEEACRYYQQNDAGEWDVIANWIGNKKGCYISPISQVIPFATPIDYQTLIACREFTAPQQWLYLDLKPELLGLLSKAKPTN